MSHVICATFIAISHLHNHLFIHSDSYETPALVRIVKIDVQAEVDVIVCGCWTRELKCIWVVGTACVCHHSRQLNDVTIDGVLAIYYICREPNKICSINRHIQGKSRVCNYLIDGYLVDL